MNNANAMELAQSFSRKYRRRSDQLANRNQSLPIRERAINLAEARAWEKAAEFMDAITDLMEETEKARRCGNTGEPARDDGLNPHHHEE